MDSTLTSAPDAADGGSARQLGSGRTQDAFSLSSLPLVSAVSAHDAPANELPRSYGSHMLCLMARDPHSLFAYWDIDWAKVFGEAVPRERKVHLRILRIDGSEEKIIDVEPMAGGDIVEIGAGNAGYVAELGYYNSAGEWKSVATSAPVSTPPELPADDVTADVATIPFHVSFQRMLDLLRVSKQESESLTTMLAALRERAGSDSAGDFHAGQRELVETIDELIAHAPPAVAESADTAAIWTRERLERVLGFSLSSTQGGLGGSSQS